MHRDSTTPNNALPAGTIILHAGNNIPEGWLLCDGTPLETGDSRYTQLFSAIGKSWNRHTDTETIFRVPELGDLSLPHAAVAWATGLPADELVHDAQGSISYIIKL